MGFTSSIPVSPHYQPASAIRLPSQQPIIPDGLRTSQIATRFGTNAAPSRTSYARADLVEIVSPLPAETIATWHITLVSISHHCHIVATKLLEQQPVPRRNQILPRPIR